jgi:hypothetical protein
MGNDHLNTLQEEMSSYRESAKQRWNFDFENEIPLEGRWQWEKAELSEPPTVEGQADADDEAPQLDADRPEH